MNLALFAFGSLKHLLFLNDGTLPSVLKAEYNNRIQHILNTLEIDLLGSSLYDFDNHSWQIGREYNARLINDIEVGLKSWESLGKSIDPTCWTFARECVSCPKQQPENFNSFNETDKKCVLHGTGFVKMAVSLNT